jgi:hypothetical protein
MKQSSSEEAEQLVNKFPSSEPEDSLLLLQGKLILSLS